MICAFLICLWSDSTEHLAFSFTFRCYFPVTQASVIQLWSLFHVNMLLLNQQCRHVRSHSYHPFFSLLYVSLFRVVTRPLMPVTLKEVLCIEFSDACTVNSCSLKLFFTNLFAPPYFTTVLIHLGQRSQSGRY